MINYPLSPEITRDQFHDLVTDLYYELTTNGLDPVFNMVIGDQDEHFAILVSETAMNVLEHKVH